MIVDFSLASPVGVEGRAQYSRQGWDGGLSKCRRERDSGLNGRKGFFCLEFMPFLQF